MLTFYPHGGTLVILRHQVSPETRPSTPTLLTFLDHNSTKEGPRQALSSHDLSSSPTSITTPSSQANHHQHRILDNL